MEPRDACLTTVNGLTASTMRSSGADVRVREAEDGLGVGDVVANATNRGGSDSSEKNTRSLRLHIHPYLIHIVHHNVTLFLIAFYGLLKCQICYPDFTFDK